MNNNLTIGFITPSIEGSTALIYLKSMHDYALKNGIKLITLPCRKFQPNKFEKKTNNIIFDLIDNKFFDGYVVWASSLFENVNIDEAEKILKKISSLPLVNIQLDDGKNPVILNDNYYGIKELIRHLIKDHNIKKIAFIRGPEKHIDAQTRYKAYREALTENIINIDEKLISPPNNLENNGKEFISQLLDEYQFIPKIDFDAIVCSSKFQAKGVIHELKKRSIKVPEKIVVTGFCDGDYDEVSFMESRLTTASFDFYKIGNLAIDTLVKKINGEFVEREILVPPDIFLRESCGCMDEDILKFLEKNKGNNKKSIIKEEIKFNKNLVITNVINALNYPNTNLKLIEKLLLTIIDNIEKKNDVNLFIEIDDIITELINSNIDIITVKKAIYNLNSEISLSLNNKKILLNFSNICEKTLILLYEKNSKLTAFKKLIDNQFEEMVISIGQKLMTAVELKDLINIINTDISKCGINWMHLYLYENIKDPKDKVRLITSFDGLMDPTKQEIKENILSSYMIFSKKFLPDINSFHIISHNLSYNEENIGIVLFSVKNSNFLNYHSLLNQISNSLKTKKLISELELSREEIKDESNNIEVLLLPMLDTIKHIATVSEEKMQSMINLKNLTEDGHKRIKSTNSFIEMIHSNIRNMRELIEIIDSISASVKILAINASISSTQSGDFGTSFSVIAKEIRKLSDKTKINAKEISSVLEKLIRETLVSKKYSNEVYLDFTDIKKDIINIADYMTDIYNRIKDLNLIGNNILNIIDLKIK